jgi:TPR repeat protein
LGQTYYETSDFADAANWLSKAALKKNLSAMAILSWMYTKGEGMPKNGEKGFNLALQAAELGGPYSQEYVGSHFFSNGDYSNAAEWYFKAAKQGNVVAEREMSWMYDHGRGVAADEREAFAWALKAAQQGDHAAMRAIAHRYENGNGVAANAVEAKMWTSKLASAESESVKTP